MSDKQLNLYPRFLQDYGNLLSHFHAQFEGLTPKERGDRFVDFVRKLVPHTSTGERFETPKVRKHSYDEGVDLECSSLDGREVLNVQSKFTLRDVDEIDRIISKFGAFQNSYASEEALEPVQRGLLDENGPIVDTDRTKVFQFMIVTTSDMTENVRRYEKSKRPSLDFYELLVREKRIQIVDGPKLLPILQKTYRKLHVIPSDFVVTFSADTIKLGDVFVGVISSLELSALYNDFGDALFIENIREFLGSPRNRQTLSDVNRDILETLEQHPEQFLSKNNGITFRANRVQVESPRALKLFDASIVNGLQTTLSVIQKPSSKCFVLVKIVESQDSWQIAKAANFQNKIDRIDLDLAEYIRPRDIQTAASSAGIGYYYIDKDSDNVFAVLDVIYNDRVSYQEIRSLFIGIFSRNPNNTIDPDYGQLRTHIIEELYRNDPGGAATFNTLFKIQKMIQTAAVEVQLIFNAKEYADLFQRFWDEAKPNYRAYIAILAICGCVRQNIYERNIDIDYATMSRFLDEIALVIERKPEVFVRYFRHAFKAVANQQLAAGKGKDRTLQSMQTSMHRAQFSPLYVQMCISADDDDKLRELTST